MLVDELFTDQDSSLVGVFGPRELHVMSVLSNLVKQVEATALVIDVNHRWSSQTVTANTTVIQPKSKEELIRLISNLPHYIHPRLSFLVVDHLPLYFRHYYGRDRLQTQNMRAYGVCLALLRRVSTQLSVLYTTYPNGLNPSEPILFNHSKYYSDHIYRGERRNGDTILFTDVETGLTIAV